MNVYLAQVDKSELLALMSARAANSSKHVLVGDPTAAELILLVGSFGRDPAWLLEHPAYKAFPDKCAVYTEDDNYLPLTPGVYCSAQEDESNRVGRTFSYAYISRNGKYRNPYLAELDSVAPADPTPEATPPGGVPGTNREKRFLFTFQGGSTSLLRKRLFNQRFNRPDVLIENTSNYYHWDESQADRVDRQRLYAETLLASHFVLCPRGGGLGSIRLFEVMAAGVAPVLMSDGYALPPGPAWDKFLIRVPERDMARLPDLLAPLVVEAPERGRLAREAFLEHFSVAREFDRIVQLAALSLQHPGAPEAHFRRQQAAMIRRRAVREKLRGLARTAFLRALKVLRLRNPYQMNER